MRDDIKKFQIIWVFIGLTACAQNADITSAPVDMTYSPNFSSQALKSIDPTEVRTYQGRLDKEITGANCEMIGQGYSALVTTPAIVRIPNFGRSTPNMTISCEHNGTVKTDVVEISNLSAEQRLRNNSQVSSGLGLVGAVVGAAVGAAMDIGGDRPGDKYGYSNGIRVIYSDE